MTDTDPRSTFTSTTIALGAAMVVCVGIIVVLSRRPAQAVYHFFVGPFLSTYHLGNMLDTASLLVLSGLGVSVAFRAGVFNLGGEGQTYIGALSAALVALAIPQWPGIPGVLVAVIAAVGVAAAVGAVSGVLRAVWGVDELITSFLVSGALLPIIDYAVSGPLRDPNSYLLSTPLIPKQFRFVPVLPPSHLNATALIALASAFGVAVVIVKTLRGYELRMSGTNRRFARYGGIKTAAYLTFPMAASAGFHGLAGSMHVLGTRYASVQSGTAGLGWNGIAVALIAESNPLAVIPAALIFAYLDAATKTAMMNTEFSFELSAVLQGLVFLFITIKGGRSVIRRRAAGGS